MLQYPMLHPEILQALAKRTTALVLIADGNYPLRTRSHPDVHHVYLNLAPDLLRVTAVLGV